MAMAAAILSGNGAHAALPATFVVRSTKAAMLLAAGHPLAGSDIATTVLSLTKEALRTMFLTKLKLGAAILLCAGLFLVLIAGSVTSAVFPAGRVDHESPKTRRPAVAEEAGEPGRETKAKKAEKEPGVLRGLIDQLDATDKVMNVTLPATRAIKDGEVVTGKSVRLENLVVGKITEITVDGKEDKIANLKPGMPVTLEIEVSFGQIVVKRLFGQIVVKRLDAKDKSKPA